MHQEKFYYSVSELAKELSMSDKGIRDLIHHHNLPASKIGKAYRIKRDDFIHSGERIRFNPNILEKLKS